MKSYLAACGWGGQLLVFLVLLTYVAVNLANLVYVRRQEFNWLLNGVVPVLGVAIDGYLIYYAFFGTLLGAEVQAGQQHRLDRDGLEVLGLRWTAVAWPRRPTRQQQQPLARAAYQSLQQRLLPHSGASWPAGWPPGEPPTCPRPSSRWSRPSSSRTSRAWCWMSASLLERAGHKKLRVVQGGPRDWQRSAGQVLARP